MDGVHVASARYIAEQVVRRAIIHFDPHGSNGDPLTGGHFNVARADDGLPLAIFRIGTVEGDFAWQTIEFCQEKARRLALNPRHSTSWQSRNPGQNKYGGAIRCAVDPRIILSFSGLPEALDTACMLMVGFLWGGDPLRRQCLLAEDIDCEAYFRGLLQAYGFEMD